MCGGKEGAEKKEGDREGWQGGGWRDVKGEQTAERARRAGGT